MGLRSLGARGLPCAISILSSLLLLPSAAHADSAPIWTGVYAGVHGGATWAEIDIANYGDPNVRDAVWGLHAGYNLAGGDFLFGFEGEANFAGADFDMSLANGGRLAAETDWSGSLRARMGLSMGPALLYGTFGLAWTTASLTEFQGNGRRTSSDETFTGIVYGIGAESFVMPNVSLRLEALRYDYSAEQLSLRSVAGLQDVDPSETVFRAGVTFHLD